VRSAGEFKGGVSVFEGKKKKINTMMLVRKTSIDSARHCSSRTAGQNYHVALLASVITFPLFSLPFDICTYVM